MLLAPLPASQTTCNRPVRLPKLGPDENLTQAQAEQLWGRDRTSLAQCANKLTGVVNAYEDVSRELSRTGK